MILEHQTYTTSFLFLEEVAIEIPDVGFPTPEQMKEFFPMLKGVEKDAKQSCPVYLTLATVLRHREEWIDEFELERRLKPLAGLLLGSREALWLLRNPSITQELDVVLSAGRVIFPGLVMSNHSSRQMSPHLCNYWGRRSLRWPMSAKEEGLSRHDWIAVNEKIIRVG